MTFRWLPIVGLVACGRAAHAPARPAIPAHAAIKVPPALYDDAEDRVRARARVAHAGEVRFEPNLPAEELELDAREPIDQVHLVADQLGGRVQLRLDGDDARLLLWIDRADLETVVVKAHALVDRASGVRGAVARPGATVKDLGGGEIQIDDGLVTARGSIAGDALGAIFDERPPRAPQITDWLASGSRVVASPDPAAPTVAEAHQLVGVVRLAPAQNGWVEIEIDREWIYARGFVPSTALTPANGGIEGSASASASTFGMSDTPTLILPSGACLYARPGGPIIGVNTAERLRYANDADQPGWRRVAIDTSWGLLWPAVHFPEKEGVPAGDFDRCSTTPRGAAP